MRINSAGSGNCHRLESSTAEVQTWFAKANTKTLEQPCHLYAVPKTVACHGLCRGGTPFPFSTNNQITYSPVPTTPPPPDRWGNYYSQPCDISARREWLVLWVRSTASFQTHLVI